MKRCTAALATCLLLAAQAPSVSLAQENYPNRPITIIVPYSAGGTTDVMGRALAASLSRQFKQSVIIENRPGVGGSMGVVAMQTAKPDGYLLTMTPVGIFRQPHIQPVSWDPIRDVTYVATFLTYDFAVTVKADSEFKTVKDLVEFARKNPGEVEYGSAGRYTGNHVVLAMLGKREGLALTHIPYKGDAGAISALLGEHIKTAVVTNSVLPHVKSGTVRVLATADESRNPAFTGVPTLKELGYDVLVPSPLGIGGPANLPEAIVQKLDQAIKAALQDPEVKTAANNFGVRTYYIGHKEYADFAKREFEAQKPLISDLGL